MDTSLRFNFKRQLLKKVPLYEEARQVGIKPDRLKELEKQMEELALNVKDPIGIDRIKTY